MASGSDTGQGEIQCSAVTQQQRPKVYVFDGGSGTKERELGLGGVTNVHHHNETNEPWCEVSCKEKDQARVERQEKRLMHGSVGARLSDGHDPGPVEKGSSNRDWDEFLRVRPKTAPDSQDERSQCHLEVMKPSCVGARAYGGQVDT